MKKFKIILFLGLFISFNLKNSHIDFALNKKPQINIINSIAAKILNESFAKDIGINSAKALSVCVLIYMSIFIHTLIHEFGHAITAKALCKSQIDIHLGTLEDSPDYLFKSKGLTIHTVMPLLGFSSYNYDPKEVENLKIKETLIRIAGPAAGIIITYLQKLILKYLSNKSEISKEFLNKLANSNYFYYFITGQILYGFTPFVFSFGDGSILWKELGIKEETINRLCVFDKLLKYEYGLPLSLLALASTSKLVFDSLVLIYRYISKIKQHMA